jgi:hypothetical protein
MLQIKNYIGGQVVSGIGREGGGHSLDFSTTHVCVAL